MSERPARSLRERKRAAAPAIERRRDVGDGTDQPTPAPRRPVTQTMRLAAEVDRLQGELDAMRRRMADLEASAERDPLTGVLNRRGFERELQRALAYLERYPASAWLVYIDLDHFKPVNDVHGHAAGDAILAVVAATLTRHVRASDGVARLGGDEFAVLLWNLGEADAHAKASALEAAITAAVVSWQNASLSVGASAGVAALAAGDGPLDVVTRADAAMYRRKGERRH